MTLSAMGPLLSLVLAVILIGCTPASDPGAPVGADATAKDVFSPIDAPTNDTTSIYTTDTSPSWDTHLPPTDTQQPPTDTQQPPTDTQQPPTDWSAVDTRTPPPPSSNLCEGPCDSDAMCGASADLCLLNQDTNKSFCGQDCSAASCPTNFMCADLGNNILQCVPQSGDCSAPAPQIGLGLCEGPCTAHESCGGVGDYCLTNPDTNQSFCGAACGTGCPTNYTCADLGSGITQCIPTSGSCSGTTPPPSCDPACAADQTCSNGVCVTVGDWETELQHCVDLINDYRSQHGRSALIRDAAIEACVANAAASDSISDIAHESFQATQGCGFTATAENEIPGYPISSYGSVTEVINRGTAQMMAEGPGGGHYENILRDSSTRVGCGVFVTSSGDVWVVQDFR